MDNFSLSIDCTENLELEICEIITPGKPKIIIVAYYNFINNGNDCYWSYTFSDRRTQVMVKTVHCSQVRMYELVI